jgi:hypothetical protein
LLVYADDLNYWGDSIDIVKKNTRTVIDTIKEVPGVKGSQCVRLTTSPPPVS